MHMPSANERATMKIVLSTVSIVFLALMTQAYAACPAGTEIKCIINGKKGIKICGSGGFGPCIPDEPEPPPVNRTVRLKYHIMTVIYAPWHEWWTQH